MNSNSYPDIYSDDKISNYDIHVLVSRDNSTIINSC